MDYSYRREVTPIYKLNDILNTDNPLETFRVLHSDILVDKLNNLIINCTDCKTDYEKKVYYGNSNANVMIINDSATNNEEVIKSDDMSIYTICVCVEIWEVSKHYE